MQNPASSLRKVVFVESTQGQFPLFVPVAFIFQNRHPLDAMVGDLSYPIYIGHFLIISVVAHAAKTFYITEANMITAVNVAASIGFAILLNVLIAARVEKFRKRISAGQLPENLVIRAGGATRGEPAR
jgi:peptidoglycan/LPS O-acetylase OafA/YrhL